MVEAASKTAATSATRPKLPTELRRSTRLGEVYWCDFSPLNWPPEFDYKHLVVVIRGAKKESGAHVVVPLTKRPQLDNPHGYKLMHNPNPGSADESWAVCDHVYTVASERLKLLRDSKGVTKEPGRIAAVDLGEISHRVFNALKPFLAQAHLPTGEDRGSLPENVLKAAPPTQPRTHPTDPT